MKKAKRYKYNETNSSRRKKKRITFGPTTEKEYHPNEPPTYIRTNKVKKNTAENNEPEAENVAVTRKGKKPTHKTPTKNPIPNHHQPSETAPS